MRRENKMQVTTGRDGPDTSNPKSRDKQAGAPPISEFRGAYSFLSNFHGGAFSLEHEYQAAKATNESDKMFILMSPTPGEAKRRNRLVRIRPDWESVKYDIMQRLLEIKFSGLDMRQKLLGTGDAELIEGNMWHDNEWGRCACAKCGNMGENILGQILMGIRDKLRSEDGKPK